MHYLVTRLPKAKLWQVSRLVGTDPDLQFDLCPIGKFQTRKEAVACARLLAGWRGTVSIQAKG